MRRKKVETATAPKGLDPQFFNPDGTTKLSAWEIWNLRQYLEAEASHNYVQAGGE